jgi:hypothetical protein
LPPDLAYRAWIAAGPVTLAFTDLFTLLFYFSLADLLL